MITRLHLTNFKNFQDAELKLGPFTLLVGTNASGKSNLRDAFRFLHGIGRGYSLAEIIGSKYGEGGERLWSGIRGGTREIVYAGGDDFALGISFFASTILKYRIGLRASRNEGSFYVAVESLYKELKMLYDSAPDEMIMQAFEDELSVYYSWRKDSETSGSGTAVRFPTDKAILSQIREDNPRHHPVERMDSIPQRPNKEVVQGVQDTLTMLNSIRFLDLNPDAMRQPSFPGQTVLGDRGENLSSVLQAICQDEKGKETLLSWVQALTPMDAVDFDFPTDQIGRILVTLVEKNGQRTTAYSASDGTLRFLGMIAALLGPEPARMYFLEELDNGIHPTRLHLLLQLIEQTVAEGKIQVIATTHSPSLLGLLSPESLENASVIYRSPENPAARIVPILDLPDARRLIQEQGAAVLFETGWLEDAIAFQDDAEVRS